MYTAILFWIAGILFTYGFNDKMFQDHNVSKKDKIVFALSFHLWFLWPLLLGDNIRRVLEKSEAQKDMEWQLPSLTRQTMIPDESKKRIEALTDSELEYEVSRGDKSRFQREKFSYLKDHYRQRRVARADSAVSSYFRMLKYLLLHDSQYLKAIGTLTATTIVPLLGLLQFDFANLAETGIITIDTKEVLIKTGPCILFAIFLISSLVLNRYFMNKYEDPSKLSDEELDKLLNYL